MNDLNIKFKELLSWYENEAKKRNITLGDIMGKLTPFWRAIKEKIDEMEKAYFAGDAQGMDEAGEKVKKLYCKAAERIKGKLNVTL